MAIWFVIVTAIATLFIPDAEAGMFGRGYVITGEPPPDFIICRCGPHAGPKCVPGKTRASEIHTDRKYGKLDNQWRCGNGRAVKRDR